MPQPNLLAVLVSALAAFILGALWYAPFLFGRLWKRLAGITGTRGGLLAYGLNFLSLLLMSYVLGSILKAVEAGTALARLMVGFWLWAGFAATITLSSVLWERRPLALYILNNAYYLLSMWLMSLVQLLLA